MLFPPNAHILVKANKPYKKNYKRETAPAHFIWLCCFKILDKTIKLVV